MDKGKMKLILRVKERINSIHLLGKTGYNNTILL